MKTITIKSEYAHNFDLFGLELITACGVVQVARTYLKRERAEDMGLRYMKTGWQDPNSGIWYKVYQANIVELVAFV